MNLKKFYIFSIIISETFEYDITEIKYPCEIKYIEIGLVYFVQNFLSADYSKFWEYNKKTLYILRNGTYSDIKEIFRKIDNRDVQIIRGADQKGHVLSPNDFRLSCYLMILNNMNFSKAYFSNGFKDLKKNKYLPSYNDYNR